jgi:hypothetical protein
MTKPSQDLQNRIVTDLLDTYSTYKDLNKARYQQLKDIYKAYSTYKEEKKADWMTDIKVNKAHEVVERVLPRIVAKNPRWIVTPKLDSFYPEMTEQRPPEGATPEMIEAYNKSIEDQRSKTKDYSRAIQDYLEYIFDEYDFENQLRYFAKTGLVYGKARAKVSYKYEIIRNLTEIEDEDGEIKKEIKEEVVGEYPYIEVKSWTETYTDPRFHTLQDSPAQYEIINAVRLSALRKKDEYFNLDKLKDVSNLEMIDDDIDTYKKQVLQIADIQKTDIKTKIDENALTLLKCWTFYDEKEDGNDKLYEACIVKDLNLLIGWKEVTKKPFVEFNVFEDVETNHSVGFVEPIIGLMDELNFQKNSAINFVNQALNRTFIWSPNSNIDPKDIISTPFGVIPTTGDVATAMANLVELPMRQLPSDYFQVQNDIERQIQGQTFTVDTSNQKSEQALTNTATGARIEFFESNSVLDLCRKNFENALSQLAYLLLQETFENMEDNIALKKLGAEEYWEINKEVLRDAVRRYSVKVEVGSSTYDDIVNRRQDAMSFWNVLMQAQEAGVKVKLKKGIEDIANTFEKKDINSYIDTAVDMNQLAQQMGGRPQGGIIPQNQMPPPQAGPAEITQQVAGGDFLTAGQ